MITEEDLAAFRDVVEGFFSTSIDIYHSSDLAGDYAYADGSAPWDDSIKDPDPQSLPATPSLTVLGWVRSRPNPDLSEELAALVNEEQTRMFVPVGTAVEKGDLAVFGGDQYQVIDTNPQNTYRVLLRCSLRRLE